MCKTLANEEEKNPITANNMSKLPFLSRALLVFGPSVFSSFRSSKELHLAIASTSASSDIECEPV